MATGESPVPEVKPGEPEHFLNVVKTCPRPLCGGKLYRMHYNCKRCKQMFTCRGKFRVSPEETIVRRMCEEALWKALTAMEQTVKRSFNEEVHAEALAIVRRMREEAAGKALTAEELTVLRTMHKEGAATAEELTVLRTMHKETAAKASTIVRRMREVGEEAIAKGLTNAQPKYALKLDAEGVEEAFTATKAKYALKPGNLTSQPKVANELSGKAGSTGGGRAGIHFEPPAGDQRESAIEEHSQERSLNLNLCL